MKTAASESSIPKSGKIRNTLMRAMVHDRIKNRTTKEGMGGKALRAFASARRFRVAFSADAPNSDPNPSWSRADQVERLREKMSGFQITEPPDGTIVANRVTKK
jgi:hypothetical protein